MARRVKKVPAKRKKAVSPARSKSARGKSPVSKRTSGKLKPKKVKKSTSAVAVKSRPKAASKSARSKARPSAVVTKKPPAKKKAPSAGTGRSNRKQSVKKAPKKVIKEVARKTVQPSRAVKPSRPRRVKAPRLTVEEKERIKSARLLRESEERQAAQYSEAVKQFNARKFGRALARFEKAAGGPNPSLRHRAGVYARICRGRARSSNVRLKTADEFYNYGIQLVNERRLDEAQQSLKRALKLQPKAGHIHLATAVLKALQADPAAAYQSLKKAIELDGRNRVLARNDPDLAGVASDPAIAGLLHGESDPRRAE